MGQEFFELFYDSFIRISLYGILLYCAFLIYRLDKTNKGLKKENEQLKTENNELKSKLKE